MKVLNQSYGNGWQLYNADTVEVCASLPESSVDFCIFSPPFASLYTYSNSDRDLGNCRSVEEFSEHFAHLLPSIHRAMRNGRLMAMHCMLLPASKQHDGYIGLKDFRGDLIRAAQRAGFVFHSEVTIWKDPVTAMQRTKAHGLLHKTIRTDSARSRTGIADFLVVMAKLGDNDKPIPHTHDEFPVERWQRYASPVWATPEDDSTEERFVVTGEHADGSLIGERKVFKKSRVDDEGFLVFRNPRKGDRETPTSGIDAGDTLQYMSAREDEDERHICPLQLGVIRRAVRLWTAKDDVVLSPFAGIGSEGYVSIQEGRKFIGAELKTSYYEMAARNLANAEPNAKGQTMSLFA